MTLDAYVDEAIGLMEKAGVTAAELTAIDARGLMAHAHMKGLPFESAVGALARKLDVEIED